MIFCDAHLHSTHSPGAELPQDGLFFSCSASRADWQDLLDEGRVLPFLGIHPEKITPSWQEDLEVLDRILEKNPQAGLGECGLDRRFYSHWTREEQEEVLRAHFTLALRHRRPVVLHQVGASGALADFLTRVKPDVPVMIHGFKGSAEILNRYLALGLFISLGPSLLRRNPGDAELLRMIPAGNLLVETDWPYGNHSEGETYRDALDGVYTGISGLLGIDKTELAGIVKRNGEIFTH